MKKHTLIQALLVTLSFNSVFLLGDDSPSQLPALLEANAFEIQIEQGNLVGTGADFLSQAVADTQFVAIGEEHNNFEIPLFTTALFRMLNQQEGYEFLLLEQDPVMMQWLSREPAKGNLENIHALARQYPKGITFISDQDLDLLAEAGAIAQSKANVIWGCEQVFGVTHILDGLDRLAPTEEARQFIAQHREKSAAAEAVRDLAESHYIADADLMPLVDGLRTHFSEGSSPQAEFMIDAIAKSNEIYGYYKAGERGEIPGYYSNNFVREEYMKDRCLSEYGKALEKDGKLPKGLLKHGSWHLYKGMTPTRVPSLGNFMFNFSRGNGLGYFSIAVTAFNENNSYGPLAGKEWSAQYKPFAPVAKADQWTLIDLRPFREYSYRRALIDSAALEDKAADELSRLIYGFDALLIIGGARKATFEVTGAPY